MRELLAERDVLPMYGQVAVLDVGTTDIPEFETGEEQLVASEHAVLVATRPDHLGTVRVQVVRGDVEGLGARVFDAELAIVSGRLAVGSIVACQMLEVQTGGAGYVPVQIFVDPIQMPERVSVVLGLAA